MEGSFIMLTPELLSQSDVDELTNVHHFDTKPHQTVMTRLSCGWKRHGLSHGKKQTKGTWHVWSLKV
jgi:hypothetical protein